MRYPWGSLSTLLIHIILDEMEAVLSRLRSLADDAGAYKQFAMYQSAADLHLELAEGMERLWTEFESLLEDLSE